jgi:membrane protein insertase Oxa1/YidC/SpoIIIJ
VAEGPRKAQFGQAAAAFGGQRPMIFVDVLNAVLIDPAINLFVLLTAFTGSAGIAVILLTCVIRALMLPLTLKQIRMTRVMSAIAPRMQEIHRANYDPKRRSEEQVRLYREMGVNRLAALAVFL